MTDIPTQPVVLKIQSAKRTEHTVQIVEHMQKGNARGPRRWPVTPIPGFWARITYLDDNPDSKRYSFQQVLAQDLSEPDVMDDNPNGGYTGDYTADTGFAFEVSGSRDVEIDSIQWLTPARNQPFYLFKDGGDGSKMIPAKILGRGTGEFDFQYSWVKLVPQDDFSFAPSDDPNDTHLFTDDDFLVDLSSFNYMLTDDYVFVKKTENKKSYECLYEGGIQMATTPVGGIAANGNAMCTCGTDTIKVYNGFATQIGKSGQTSLIQIGHSPLKAQWYVISEACS